MMLIGCGSISSAADRSYQDAMDPIRIQATERILNIVLAYRDKAGHFPFGKIAQEQPVMVLLAHSFTDEQRFAAIDALNKGALLLRADELEAELSNVLGQTIVLPRDPQTVATYAPNVYLYFLTPEDDVCAVAHLYFPTNITVEYSWEGGRFNSYANCISKIEKER